MNCLECGGPVAIKPPHTPGRQTRYCCDRCKWRARKRRNRAIAWLPDDVLVTLSHAELSRLGIDMGGVS